MKCFALLITLTASLILSEFATAQVSNDQRARRRAFMEDLLKGLIESQTEPRHDDHAHDQGHRHENNPGTRPVDPGRTFRPAPTPPPRVAVSPDMIKARQQLQQWQSASQNLVSELRYHEQESPVLRPLMADALKIQASIDVLSQKAMSYPIIDPLVNEFAVIDRDWRVLAHRLKQTGALSSECLTFVNSIAEMDTQLCGIFKIEPQIDREQLMRLTAELNSHFKHLLQDVYYQTRGTNNGTRLVSKGQELYTLINQSSTLISHGRYDSIVNAYRNCNTQWREFSQQLRSVPDQRIRREVQEIELLGRQIHQQLWLPVEIDRSYLAHLAETIHSDASHVFDSVSIHQLMSIQQPESVLNAVREFQNSCGSFDQSIASGKPIHDLAWDFRSFKKQWDNLHDVFHRFHVSEIDNQLEEIEFTFNSLDETFGDSATLDHASLIQMAASLDQLCHELHEEIHRRIRTNRYDRSFRDQIDTQSDHLHESVHQMHSNLISRTGGTVNLPQMATIFQQWNDLKPMLSQCQPNDLQPLMEIRRQIEPLMVKLQLVFVK